MFISISGPRGSGCDDSAHHLQQVGGAQLGDAASQLRQGEKSSESGSESFVEKCFKGALKVSFRKDFFVRIFGPDFAQTICVDLRAGG